MMEGNSSGCRMRGEAGEFSMGLKVLYLGIMGEVEVSAVVGDL